MIVKWRLDLQYFAAQITSNVGYWEDLSAAMKRFEVKFNCTITSINDVECSEEDFLIIQLTCPEAIVKVLP